MVLTCTNKRFWRYFTSLAAIVVAGCQRAAPARQPGHDGPPVALSPARPQQVLPLGAPRAAVREMLLGSMAKRIEGRRRSLPEITRVATEIRPIVESAAASGSARALLVSIAHRQGRSVRAVASDWVDLQCADILLESGGDPDALSPAGAAGAAQWMPGTGAGQGLRVDLANSRTLSLRIDILRWQIAWMRYALRPAGQAPPTRIPAEVPQDPGLLPGMEAETARLRLERATIDERYDSGKSIRAQTRYLLGLYRRFPSFDWLFQAYHGGEGGASKTLREYSGIRSAAAAITRGRSGRRLTFEDCYFGASPRRHNPAWRYLYSRSDDHRHYWWKLLAARRALDLYRRAPDAMAAAWARWLPDRPMDGVWYPGAEANAYSNGASARAALSRGELVPFVETRTLTLRAAPPGPATEPPLAAARPATIGMLRLIERAYALCGGAPPLTVGDLTTNSEYARQQAMRDPVLKPGPIWPPELIEPRIGGGPPVGFDYHTTGIAADIIPPADRNARAVLEYALGYLADRQVLNVIEAKDHSEQRYHCAPNPAYRSALGKLASGTLPAGLPNLFGLP